MGVAGTCSLLKKMEEHVEKKMKVDEEEKKEPKKLEDMLTRYLESQKELAEIIVELFKRLEQPKIKELWS